MLLLSNLSLPLSFNSVGICAGYGKKSERSQRQAPKPHFQNPSVCSFLNLPICSTSVQTRESLIWLGVIVWLVSWLNAIPLFNPCPAVRHNHRPTQEDCEAPLFTSECGLQLRPCVRGMTRLPPLNCLRAPSRVFNAHDLFAVLYREKRNREWFLLCVAETRF